MKDLLPLAERAGALLKEKKQTIVVAESSTGGLIAAALLTVPGASAYFLGGSVVYTRQSRLLLLEIPDAALDGTRPSTEAYALMMARKMRERFDATWSIAETGATGPTGNRYGDAAGHSCIAIAGPVERAMTLETGQSDRVENMQAFTKAALEFLVEAVG